MKRVFAGIVGLAFAGSAGIAYSDPTQWAGNGHWYDAVLVGSPGINWEDANSAAIARGGYLASITTSAEDDFAYSLISSNDAFWFLDNAGNGIGPWLGGYQYDHLAEPAGDWAWTTGETWSYTNWMPYEPTNGAGHSPPGDLSEDYLQFAGWQTLKSANWNDYRDIGWPQTDGSQGLPRGYIVEFDTIPEPSTLAVVAMAGIGLLCRRRR